MYKVRNVETKIIANDRDRDEYSVRKVALHGGKQNMEENNLHWQSR